MNDKLVLFKRPNTQFLIPELPFLKYNAKSILQITFTRSGLENLNKRYGEVRGLPGFIHNMLRGRDGSKRELVLGNEQLCCWSDDFQYMILPGGSSNNPEDFICNHRSLKNKLGGFALVGWVIDPRLFKCYAWDTRETFKNFLIKNYKSEDNSYKDFKRSDSQEEIRKIEQINPENSYPATILNLRAKDVDFLKLIQKVSLKHLEDTYGVNLNKDLVELFFHFPYGEETTTLHLHIRVNQGRHPLERKRSIALQKIITLLENGENIIDFICNNNPYYMENSQVVLNILSGIDGITIEETANPFCITSSLIDRVNTIENLVGIEEECSSDMLKN